MSNSTTSQRLSLGVLAKSRKPDERRLPIHPAHLSKIEPELRRRIWLEHGYGEEFGATDTALAELVGGIASRQELVARSDIVLLPKVRAEDLAEFADGQIVLGWPHCVQDADLTQIAIDHRQTLIAFEAMNHWQADGGFGLHVFHKNNELAGYCSVIHAMQLAGVTGSYGRRLRAAVIGFGATARGAVTALNAHGVDDVRVLTTREVAAVGAPIPGTQIVQMGPDDDDPSRIWADTEDGEVPVADFLARHDIVVNCVLQNPEKPLVFVTEDDLPGFTPGSLLIDVSCDAGMGFSWAQPTTFSDPTVDMGDHLLYYAVDHSPSYLWNSATWEISEALLPHLETLLAGPEAWADSPTIRRAIEIRDGTVLNPAILAFQGREEDYPHQVRSP
jgi:alanine dehydrogenase